MIVKRPDGYYVLTANGKRELGGPYSTRDEAAERLGQVEHFAKKDKGK